MSGDNQSNQETTPPRGCAQQHELSTRAEPLTASGQNQWPPTGTFVTAYGQDLMAADIK
jgi:hypothetical protein